MGPSWQMCYIRQKKIKYVCCNLKVQKPTIVNFFPLFQKTDDQTSQVEFPETINNLCGWSVYVAKNVHLSCI